MKASIAKAIAWNSLQYRQPSGDQATGGYPAEHGFGHEEWNNQPSMIWRGYRVFHTERTDRLLEYSRSGELGMLMIVSRAGKQIAVGVAAGVYDNSPEERELIAAELGMYEKWNELWRLSLVRSRFGDDQARFLKFWKKEHKWLSWKTQPQLYHWFKRPFELDAVALTGKKRLAPHFSTFHPLRPQKIAELIRGQAPRDIVEWFEQPDFDEDFFGRHKDRSRQKRSGDLGPKAKANSPASRAVKYWVYGERSYEPLHHLLQGRYKQFLNRRGIVVEENQDWVDLRYVDQGKRVFAELKPTEIVPARFAIRVAVGQLLEHQFRLDTKARLEIVLSTKPEAEDVGFVKSLGIALWYWNVTTFTQAA